MPKENPDGEAALRKLGQRLREGWAKNHPVTEKSLETIKNGVREQWEQEQQATRGMTARKSPTRTSTRKPEEPDQDR